jgi:hypothetical protein
MAMDHRSKNEINAISTLVGNILPLLFPGIWYYEEGCIALEHDGEIFCVVIPDGSGRVAQNTRFSLHLMPSFLTRPVENNSRWNFIVDRSRK